MYQTSKILSEEEMINIEKKANELFHKIEYKFDDRPIDVIEVAKRLGFVVGNAALSEDSDGFIIVREGADEIFNIQTDKLIGVNSIRELPFKRFIIAHEIGHYILHYMSKPEKGMYAHREHTKGKDKSENEADFFAACLLMPSEDVKKKFEELKSKELSIEDIIPVLMSRFNTTKITTERRLKELELHV